MILLPCLYILLFSLLPILVRSKEKRNGDDNSVNFQVKNNANKNGTMQDCKKFCKRRSSQRHKKCHSSHQGLFSSEKLPTFTWLRDQTSPDGVPLLAIKFPDGKPDDVAILKKFKPIPRQVAERNENIDKCLFVGHMRDEPSAHVTLAGGCPFEDKLSIIMWSKRSPINMFSMSNSVVTSIPSVFGTKGIYDIVIYPPGRKKPVPPKGDDYAKKKPVPPKAYDYVKINVAINMDETFRSQFGTAAEAIVNRVGVLSNAWFHHPSLGSIVEFAYNIGVTISEKIEASHNDIQYVAKYNKDQYNTNVYICYQNSSLGSVGIAKMGSVCLDKNRRTAIVEYFNTDIESAQILAHEVGHNLGMDHDFYDAEDGVNRLPRYDSLGLNCTNIGGVMDYDQIVTHWSTCSVEDYQTTDTECLEHSFKNNNF